MSDLEDDILMAYLKSARELEGLKERGKLTDAVWSDLDRLLKRMLKEPGATTLFETELLQLKKSVVAVLTYDAEHSDGTTAGGGGSLG